MSIKFGSIIVIILAIFIAKVSIENFNSVQAGEVKVTKLR